MDNITTCTRANNNNNKRQQITEKPKEFYREKLKDHEGIGGGEREGKIKLYGGEKRKRGRDGGKKETAGRNRKQTNRLGGRKVGRNKKVSGVERERK